MAGRLVQHGDRLAGLAGGDQRAAQADLGRDGAGVIGPEDLGASGRHPPEPGHGLGRLPGCQQRAGQQAARQDGVGVAWPEEPVAAGGQLPPPGDRRAGQPGGVQAVPGRQQQPVAAAAVPQRITRGLPQARGA